MSEAAVAILWDYTLSGRELLPFPSLILLGRVPPIFMSVLSYARAQDENEKPTQFHLTLAALEKFLARTPIK